MRLGYLIFWVPVEKHLGALQRRYCVRAVLWRVCSHAHKYVQCADAVHTCLRAQFARVRLSSVQACVRDSWVGSTHATQLGENLAARVARHAILAALERRIEKARFREIVRRRAL